MSAPQPDTVLDRARRKRQRGWLVAGTGLLLLLSLVLPHVHLRDEHQPGRTLMFTQWYFLHVQPSAFSPPVDVPALALGINVTYLGLALHELGLLLVVATWWVLYPEEIHRWLYLLLVIGGWLLLLSVPLVLLGPVLVGRAGVPASVGVAWVPLLISGLVLTVAARRAKERIDNTWYLAGLELM